MLNFLAQVLSYHASSSLEEAVKHSVKRLIPKANFSSHAILFVSRSAFCLRRTSLWKTLVAFLSTILSFPTTIQFWRALACSLTCTCSSIFTCREWCDTFSMRAAERDTIISLLPYLGSFSVDIDREEKLQASDVSQLETRFQRCPEHVRYFQGTTNFRSLLCRFRFPFLGRTIRSEPESSGTVRSFDSLFLPRSRSPRNE